MKLNSVSATGIVIILLLSSLILGMGGSSANATGTGYAKYFAVFYLASLSSGSSVVTYEGEHIILSSSTTGLFCYIPQLNSTTLVGSSTSYNWASNYNRFCIVDDRVFFVTVWPVDVHGVETASFDEYYLNGTLGTKHSPQEFSHFYNPYSFTVVGNNLYFHDDVWNNLFSGDFGGGGLWFANMTSGAEKQLLDRNDPDNYGELVSAGGNLFRYNFTADGKLIINQLNLDTGKIAKHVQLFMPQGPNDKSFSDWQFTADKNSFYIAAQTPDDNGFPVIYLWSIPLTDFENDNILNGPNNYWFDTRREIATATMNEANANIYSISASQGNVLLDSNDFTILYDSNGQTYTIIPGQKDRAQILYGATNPPAIPEMTPLFAAAASIVATCAITIFIKKKTQSRLTPYFNT